MPTARWGARALALAAVALASLALASEPAKRTALRKNGESEVYFGAHPAEWVCYDAPYKLTVYYTAGADDLRLTLSHSGNKTTPANHDVAKGSGSVEFEIDYVGDTTGTAVTATLHAKNNPGDVKATYTRYDLCFLKGMMLAQPVGAQLKAAKPAPPVDLPAGVKAAEMAEARKGKQVPAGFHHGEFTPRDKYVVGGQVRYWVQSRTKGRTPKMEYDRTATLVQQRVNGKWELKWFEILPKALGEPNPPAGTSYFVIVALLDADGRVLEMRPHW